MTRVYVVICTKCNEEYIGMLDKGKERFKTEFELVSMKISDAPVFKTVLPILAAPHFWGWGGGVGWAFRNLNIIKFFS